MSRAVFVSQQPCEAATTWPLLLPVVAVWSVECGWCGVPQLRERVKNHLKSGQNLVDKGEKWCGAR
jgi:hypothetical protein